MTKLQYKCEKKHRNTMSKEIEQSWKTRKRVQTPQNLFFFSFLKNTEEENENFEVSTDFRANVMKDEIVLESEQSSLYVCVYVCI